VTSPNQRRARRRVIIWRNGTRSILSLSPYFLVFDNILFSRFSITIHSEYCEFVILLYIIIVCVLPERKTAAAADVQYAVRTSGRARWGRRGGGRIRAITNKNECCDERIGTPRTRALSSSSPRPADTQRQRPLRHNRTPTVDNGTKIRLPRDTHALRVHVPDE